MGEYRGRCVFVGVPSETSTPHYLLVKVLLKDASGTRSAATTSKVGMNLLLFLRKKGITSVITGKSKNLNVTFMDMLVHLQLLDVNINCSS